MPRPISRARFNSNSVCAVTHAKRWHRTTIVSAQNGVLGLTVPGELHVIWWLVFLI